jgi:hypothetical protein
VEITGTEGCSNVFTADGRTNTRVTQDCSLRSQAGEQIAVNPLDPDNILVGQNDARTGYNRCGYAWTLDGGAHWGNDTPPFSQVPLLDNHAGEACTDPTVAWDSQGNAYIASTVYKVGAPENAVVVAKSNPGIHGAYFHSPDSSSGFQEYRTMPAGVVSNEDVASRTSRTSPRTRTSRARSATGCTSRGRASPPRRRLLPRERGRSSPSCSASPKMEASRGRRPSRSAVRPKACVRTSAISTMRRIRSWARDGTIYVSFANDNAIGGGMQILMVKCAADEDCTEEEAWTEPVIVSNLIGGEPFGPSDTGCPNAVQCLPPNSYRMSESNSVTNSVDDQGRVYVVWADFRNNTNPEVHGLGAESGPALRQRRLLRVLDGRG